MPSNTQFPKATYRNDPYKSYRFRVKWDGKYVAGITKVSALRRTTEPIRHREGSEAFPARLMPGRTEYAPITLERGVTHDPSFEQWANKVWNYQNSLTGGGNENVSLADFRKDIILEVYNEAGQKVIAYFIYRCWPSEFVALPDLDASGNVVAIQSLTLQNEGWERDTSVTEPTEPSFTLPLS